jgi:peptidyl-prolyl cis-trans isomerase C
MTQFFQMPWGRRLAVAAAALVVAACSKSPQTAAPAVPEKSVPAPVATVDGTAISRAAFDEYVKELSSKANTEFTPEQKSQILDDVVNMQLISAQSLKDGLDKDPEWQARLELTRLRLLAEAESQKYLKGKEPSDAELHAEYASAVTGLDKTEYHARHILVASKELAEQLTKRIKGGAKFDAIAKTESLDTLSKPKGGQLDWFTLSRMEKPFADAVKGLKKGEMTAAPVQTRFGWHIIQLQETRDAPPPPFEQVKQQLVNRVMQKKLLAYIEELKKTAKIDKKL